MDRRGRVGQPVFFGHSLRPRGANDLVRQRYLSLSSVYVDLNPLQLGLEALEFGIRGAHNRIGLLDRKGVFLRRRKTGPLPVRQHLLSVLPVGVHTKDGRHILVEKFTSPLRRTRGGVDARKRLRRLREGVGLEAGAAQGDGTRGAFDVEPRCLVERFYTDRTGWSRHLNAARTWFPPFNF